MLGIDSIGLLARSVRSTPRQLYDVADRVDELVQVYDLVNPATPRKKLRTVSSPTGSLRYIQTGLLRNLFRPRLWHSRHSYGGIPGRNALQNALRHANSRFVYTTDVANFFPSIGFYTVRNLFEQTLGCSPEVSHLLARLCTHNGCLAQGLITSPIIADRAVRRVDVRIAGVARQHDLVYTRFVDDITLSGCFSLDREESGIVSLVRRIITDSKLQLAADKEQSGPVDDGDIAITGLRKVNGHLDVVADYVQHLEGILDAHRILGTGGDFTAPFFLKAQLQGRVDYVCSINPHRARSLRARLGTIDWDSVGRAALDRGLIVCRKRLEKRERAPSAVRARLTAVAPPRR